MGTEGRRRGGGARPERKAQNTRKKRERRTGEKEFKAKEQEKSISLARRVATKRGEARKEEMHGRPTR